MKIIRLYFRYFFSVSNLIVISLLMIFLFISYFISLDNINIQLSYEEVLKYYYENSIYFTKLILLIFSCFLFMKLHNEKNEYIINIIMSAGYSKKDNYKKMIISYLIILLFIIIILFIGFIVIGYLKLNYFNFDILYLRSFCYLYLMIVYYGFITYLLQSLFNNQFIFIGTIVLFVISEFILGVEEDIKFIYLYFFPNFNNNIFIINELYIILVIFIVYILNMRIYLNKDLKS